MGKWPELVFFIEMALIPRDFCPRIPYSVPYKSGISPFQEGALPVSFPSRHLFLFSLLMLAAVFNSQMCILLWCRRPWISFDGSHTGRLSSCLILPVSFSLYKTKTIRLPPPSLRGCPGGSGDRLKVSLSPRSSLSLSLGFVCPRLASRHKILAAGGLPQEIDTSTLYRVFFDSYGLLQYSLARGGFDLGLIYRSFFEFLKQRFKLWTFPARRV